jgi:hypothetical protein
VFDLSKITDVVSSLFGQAAQQGLPQDLMQHVESLGIDLTALQGMEPGQIMEHLASQGIDLAGLDPAQISQLAAQLGESGIGGQLAEWISNRGGRS